MIKQSVIQFTSRISNQNLDKQYEDPVSILDSVKILIENTISLKQDKILLNRIKKRIKRDKPIS